MTRLILGLAVASVAAGCASRGPQTLSADAFLPKPSPSTSNDSPRVVAAPPASDVAEATPKKASMLITPAAGESDAVRPLEPLSMPTTAPVDPAAPTTQPTELSTADAPTAAAPTTAPAAPPIVLNDSLYMTLGGVVAEVNGVPIYANQLLQLLDRQLAAKAREMDPNTFRAYARTELDRQRRELIASEAEYAAAQRLLTADDKKIIEQYAMPRFVQQKITEAGGSMEMAKHKARVEGLSFDDMIQQEHRRMMQELFYQRRIIPRIQVSAADMREYYRNNLDKTYTEHAQAQFRVIKIDPARIGGANARQDALDRIKGIRERAIDGVDFATLASTENQDDYLKGRAGDPGGWMQRDSYRIDAVDKAVWKLKPGEVSDVIEDGGAFYLAKLEARKDGRVRPFEDQAVQDQIRDTLWQQQFRLLREKVRQELESEAVVRTDDKLLDTAVDMAMQKYQQWASR